MREFVLYSRLGRTDSNWASLHGGGRLDIVYECTVASLFLSHAIRRYAKLHAILHGPPNPPLHLEIAGANLYDVRTDQQTWTQILKKVLSGKPHPGITRSKTSFEALLREKALTSPIYVLEEKGKIVTEVDVAEDAVFVLGDHVGLPKKAEDYALRHGVKVSLGKTPYLAAHCITVLNYLLDKHQE